VVKNIDIMILEPGITKTEFTIAANAEGLENTAPAFTQCTSEYVGRATLDGIYAKKRYIIPSYIDYVTSLMRFLPRTLVVLMLGKAHKQALAAIKKI